MFVGYSKDHDGDCYNMWYRKTNRVYTKRDVIWLNKMYFRPDEDGAKVIEIPAVVIANGGGEEKDDATDAPDPRQHDVMDVNVITPGGATR
jgi:hypothetical protein